MTTKIFLLILYFLSGLIQHSTSKSNYHYVRLRDELWEFPACWESNRLKGRNTEASRSFQFNFDRIVIIGDIHGDFKGLHEILSYTGILNRHVDDGFNCNWNNNTSKKFLLIQTGDVVDRGPATIECFNCLKSLQATAISKSHKVIRLLGNHELMWLEGDSGYRNKETDLPDIVNTLIKQIMIDILDGNLLGSFYLHAFGRIPILFSHAGLRHSLKSYIEHKITNTTTSLSSPSPLASSISTYINTNLQQSIATCRNKHLPNFEDYKGPIQCGDEFLDSIYSIGSERGGFGLGGCFWTDFSILSQEANITTMSRHPSWDFVQVVGHSLAVGKIRSTERLSSTCVDAGMFLGGRAFLEIDYEGRFIAHEKKFFDAGSGDTRGLLRRDGWSVRDLSQEFCT